MCYLIATIKNHRIYYLVDVKNEVSRVWTENKNTAKIFVAKGSAEYFATTKGLNNILIKEVAS